MPTASRVCPVDLHCAPVPCTALATPATLPGRQAARPFRHPEIIAVDPAYTECCGSYGYPDPPRKSDPPR